MMFKIALRSALDGEIGFDRCIKIRIYKMVL